MNSGKKFIETRDGKVDYSNAQFKMQLVGNKSLGEELLREAEHINRIYPEAAYASGSRVRHRMIS